MTFEIALTGINAASTELNTISNNIANNATTGFKRSRAEFADVYAQSALGSSGVTTGSGVRVSNVRQEHTQGDMLFTDRNLDLAVEGLGMFRLDDNGSAIYTRAGNFGLDNEGYLVNTRGNKLTGFGVDANAAILPITRELQIDYTDLQPNKSSRVELMANLDSKALVPGISADGSGTALAFDVSDPTTYNFSTSTVVYDSLGTSDVANLFFQKSTPTSWMAYPYVGTQLVSPGGVELTFDSSGTLEGLNGGTETTFTSIPYTPQSGGAAEMSLNFDLGEITQFDDNFGVNRISQDGFAAGRLENFDVDSEGVIYGRFSNGQAKTMGQVTLSNFANESGLRQVGTTSWSETSASGEPATGAPGSASLGKVQSGALEGSNVDITNELVSMITAQRSFQANAKVISTGDTLTQTVINIGR